MATKKPTLAHKLPVVVKPLKPAKKKVVKMNERKPVVNFLSALRTPVRSLVRLWHWASGTGGVAFLYLKSGHVVKFRANNVKFVSGMKRSFTYDTPKNSRLALQCVPDLNEIVAVVIKN